MKDYVIEILRTSDLVPYENNPRRNDEAVEQVASSIREFGFKVPIIIDKNNVIVAGHTRLKACERLGITEVPCIRADDLTDDQIKAFRLADNKVGEIATWDDAKLEIELDAIEMDMSEFGFDLEIDPVEIGGGLETDEIPDPPAEPKTKRGDIYQLGRHRLMCGDATSFDDVDKLVDETHIDLALTDPPYGIDIVGGNKSFGKVGGNKSFGKVGGGQIVEANTYMVIKGDDTTETAQENYNIIQSLTDNQIIFGGNYFTDFLHPSRCWIVWDKENTGNFADAELAWTSFEKSVKLYRWMWNGLARKGDRSTELVKRVHPTQKPVGLFIEILKEFSSDNDTIIDCFGGSGSILIACEKTGRNCLMMEYEPHYCDVIIERWETLTGDKAMLL